jgi:glycosyltransferase involved in cell wall biosynthesis
MRVAFVAPLPFSIAFGGLEIQVLRTAEALRALGVQVDLLDPWKQAFDADLLHCFGSEYQLGEIVGRARDRGVPVVVSSVFLPRRADALYRVWRHVDRLVPVKTSFGVRREVLAAADAVIALTGAEAATLDRLFGTSREKIHVIPNGVDERFFAATADVFEQQHGLSGFALCVAAVEPRKNQRRLINALHGMGMPLVLIGPSTVPDGPYARAVADAVRAEPGWLWIDGLPNDSPLLPSAYAAASVCVLPSLTEGQPLAALEAAAAGANLVVSDLPYLRDTFGASAWYCDPRSPSSIRRAVFAAAGAPRGARYAERPAWLQPWRDVAVRVQDVYRIVLEGRSVARAQPGLAGPQTQ